MSEPTTNSGSWDEDGSPVTAQQVSGMWDDGDVGAGPSLSVDLQAGPMHRMSVIIIGTPQVKTYQMGGMLFAAVASLGVPNPDPQLHMVQLDSTTGTLTITYWDASAGKVSGTIACDFVNPLNENETVQVTNGAFSCTRLHRS